MKNANYTQATKSVERAILSAFLQEAIRRGYWISICADNGEGQPVYPFTRSVSEALSRSRESWKETIWMSPSQNQRWTAVFEIRYGRGSQILGSDPYSIGNNDLDECYDAGIKVAKELQT